MKGALERIGDALKEHEDTLGAGTSAALSTYLVKQLEPALRLGFDAQPNLGDTDLPTTEATVVSPTAAEDEAEQPGREAADPNDTQQPEPALEEVTFDKLTGIKLQAKDTAAALGKAGDHLQVMN